MRYPGTYNNSTGGSTTNQSSYLATVRLVR
jgi:hypothetical protein